MEGPISEEDAKLIQDLVKIKAEAPESWKPFHVHIKGRAKTYEEACKKLKNLELNDSVLTCDSDEDDSGLQSEMLSAIKRRFLLKEKARLAATVVKVKDDSDTSSSDSDSKVKSSNDNDSKDNVEKTNTASPDKSYAEENLLDSFVQTVKLPVIDISHSYQGKNDFEKAILNSLMDISVKCSELNSNVNQCNHRLERIENYLVDKKLITNPKAKIEDKFGVKIPLQSLEDFKTFDDLLKDKLVRQDIVNSLRKLVLTDGVISRSYLGMIKSYMGGDLPTKFTAARASGDKIVLRKTQFGKCMDFAILEKRKSMNLKTEDSELTAKLSDVLSNAKKIFKPLNDPAA